jgi:Fuc2NAc and GlcNAc transferase
MNSKIILLLSLFLLAFFGVYLYVIIARKLNIVDVPNERSSHTRIVVRGGGLVFVIFWFLLLFYYFFIGQLCLAITLPFAFGLIIALIAFVDDCIRLHSVIRLFIYAFVSLFAVLSILGISGFSMGAYLVHLGVFGSVFAFLALFWSLNLYNFMDGIDGIAAIEAIFIFSVGGFLFFHAGAMTLAILAWGLVALICGFLFWNFPPAKIFMGDVGSTFLGFMVVVFALIGEKYYQIPAVFWMMLYGVFLFDSTVTLLRRLFKGEKVYLPHRLHAYQRIFDYGWSNKKVLMGLVLLNSIIAILVVVADINRNNWIFLFIALEIIILAVAYLLVESKKPLLFQNRD